MYTKYIRIYNENLLNNNCIKLKNTSLIFSVSWYFNTTDKQENRNEYTKYRYYSAEKV